MRSFPLTAVTNIVCGYGLFCQASLLPYYTISPTWTCVKAYILLSPFFIAVAASYCICNPMSIPITIIAACRPWIISIKTNRSSPEVPIPHFKRPPWQIAPPFWAALVRNQEQGVKHASTLSPCLYIKFRNSPVKTTQRDCKKTASAL